MTDATQTIPENVVNNAIENPEQASTNFYWIWDTDGQVFNLQTTVRGTLTTKQVQAHIKTAMETIAHVQELGGIAKQVGRNSSIETKTSQPAEGLPVGDTAATADSVDVDDFTFETSSLVVSSMDGKLYMKIRGGMYTKFGVTVWPEVLESIGVKVDQLQPKEYPMPDYIATFTKNDKGQPHKVARLVKVANT